MLQAKNTIKTQKRRQQAKIKRSNIIKTVFSDFGCPGASKIDLKVESSPHFARVLKKAKQVSCKLLVQKMKAMEELATSCEEETSEKSSCVANEDSQHSSASLRLKDMLLSKTPSLPLFEGPKEDRKFKRADSGVQASLPASQCIFW